MLPLYLCKKTKRIIIYEKHFFILLTVFTKRPCKIMNGYKNYPLVIILGSMSACLLTVKITPKYCCYQLMETSQ